MNQKIFKHSPHRGADAIKILAGTKTNATIRDLEETTEDIEEKEGVVVSIDKDKINGDGWEVKTDDGETIHCSVASNMYELPETEDYGGMYYPKKTVKVKITINPVLKRNTITEVITPDTEKSKKNKKNKNDKNATDTEDEEAKIDLSQWKHGDKATTIIAKPKSAISISDALISFNYNNANKITADKDEVKTKGKKTSIHTNALDIKSTDIKIKDMVFEDFLEKEARNAIINGSENYQNENIDIIKQNNLGQINLDIPSIYIPSKTQRIIMDLKDPSLYPDKVQRHPLLTGSNIDELYIYPNGLVTVKSRGAPRYDTDIFSTHNWATTPYTYKNLINVSVVKVCDCCNDGSLGERTFFNYCPICKTWNTLYNKNNVISCTSCHTEWCQSCGHPHEYDCTNKAYDLKEYSLWRITAIGLPCSYCKDDISYGKNREYANYCPKCHKWGYLTLETEYEDGEERRFLHCDYCHEDYCVNCSISQGKSFIKNFINDNTNYDYASFTNKYSKIKHIRDD